MVSDGPVAILEHHSLYQQNFPVPADTLDFFLPFGKAKVVNSGRAVTVLGYGSITGRLLSLLRPLEERGVCPEIIDLRSLDWPSIDWAAITESVKKTGALVIAEEAPAGQSIGQRIASEALRRCFDHLDHPPLCLSSLDVPNPVSQVLERAVMLDDRAIVEGTEAAAKRRAI